MIELINFSKKAGELIVRNSSIYFSSVLMFKATGKVWVDHAENPSFALVYSDYQEGFQFMGNTVAEDKYEEIREFFDTVIIDFMKERDITSFEYGADSDKILKIVEKIFDDKDIGKSKQLIFTYKSYRRINEKYENYKIVPINNIFLNSCYSNMEYVLDEIILSNGNIENYLLNGFGYAAVDGERIIARAMVIFSYENMDNIGICTLEEYRNKGLSTVLTNKVLDHIVAKNHIPIWDCDEDNEASKRVAEKCGFIESNQEEICWFEI